MAITNLNLFLSRYFEAHHCDILQNDAGVLTVQLTEEMDRSLMNRPFYWHYIKKIGKTGDPMQLTLITNPDKRDVKGEWIHFGSPRLQQILHHIKQHEKFTKLFQKVTSSTINTALHPWLVTNIKISYIGKHKKDELFSIGLNLVNGMMKSDMMNLLKTVDLQMTIADYCYTISPIIKLKSGFKRIETVIDNYINNQDHQWMVESLQESKNEVHLLKHFYAGKTKDESEQMEKEIQEISERYDPRIIINVVNGGIFYLEA